MQAIHESGHVTAAYLTGGQVATVVLHPFTISRTDLSHNPKPAIVVWAGPVFGVLLPLALWGAAAGVRLPGVFVLRFFAGFCLVANGAYIAGGSFDGIGDCGEMLRHGSERWHLWLFGAGTVPAGFWLWHGQGKLFGLGTAREKVSAGINCSSVVVCLLLLASGVTGRFGVASRIRH